MTSLPSTPSRATPASGPLPDTLNGGTRFLDPVALLETSGGQRFVPPAWPVFLIALGLVIASAALSGPDVGPAQSVVVAALLILWFGHHAVRRATGRSVNAEVQAVVALEELVLLRRWTEAADLAQRILSRPMFLRERRLNALRSLATILSRYHRFEDARVVFDYLLSEDNGFEADPSTAHSIRVSRAIGMLREDRLVDADKAMSDLRREVNRARDEIRRIRGVEAANEVQSAGLALLEIYRDVKTRHFEEAIAVFEKSSNVMREQLGMRIADAWVLVAAARDGLGHTEAAQLAYTNATSLAPPVELHRRYPETAFLANKFTPVFTPSAGQTHRRAS